MEGLPFGVRGIVEGFYGSYLTPSERDDLIRFGAAHGFNLYVYAPKSDRQHRARWWEPYPATIMARFAQTASIARDVGVNLCYALSLDASAHYAAEETFTCLTAKLTPFLDLGVRAFALLYDDTDCVLSEKANNTAFRGCADAHAYLANRVYAWLAASRPGCTLTVCPRDYHGMTPFSAYLRDLGALLHAAISLFYCGPDVCSREITVTHAETFARATGRPPLIWDNYPVNDLAMRGEIHLGPVSGRNPGLSRAVRGVVANTMSRAEASKVPLATIADFLRDPYGYDAQQSWMHAARAIAGEDSADALRLFAQSVERSCLSPWAPDTLARLCAASTLCAKRSKHPARTRPLLALLCHVDQIDAACYHLKNRMDNEALRRDLLPWIEATEAWLGVARASIAVLRAAESGDDDTGRAVERLTGALDDAHWSPLWTIGHLLEPLAVAALTRHHGGVGHAGDDEACA